MTPYIPSDLLTLVDVAPSYGVTPDAIQKALKRDRRPVYKLGRLNAARVADLEWYNSFREWRAPSAPKRPPGWVGAYGGAELAGVSRSILLAMIPHPMIHPVRVGRLYYYDPAELIAFRKSREGIPPGWVSVPDLTLELSAERGLVARIVLLARMKTRVYYQFGSTGTPKRSCISFEDAERVRRAVAARQGVTP
jgi:hypothetical protein